MKRSEAIEKLTDYLSKFKYSILSPEDIAVLAISFSEKELGMLPPFDIEVYNNQYGFVVDNRGHGWLSEGWEPEDE
jgi:hypothetical protein